MSGTPRPLRAEPSLTLYRVTQEALTNAAKHAPDAPVTARLSFDDQAVTLTVHNDLPDPGLPHPLSGSGGGYGLLGMKERVQQACGTARPGRPGRLAGHRRRSRRTGHDRESRSGWSSRTTSGWSGTAW